MGDREQEVVEAEEGEDVEEAEVEETEEEKASVGDIADEEEEAEEEDAAGKDGTRSGGWLCRLWSGIMGEICTVEGTSASLPA